jgi:uncharacterized protein YneF (UPF0154 family)
MNVIFHILAALSGAVSGYFLTRSFLNGKKIADKPSKIKAEAMRVVYIGLMIIGLMLIKMNI